MYCCENFETDICENCGLPVIKEDFGMLPSFGYSVVPYILTKVNKRDKNGRIRTITYERPIRFPAAFMVAANIPGHNKARYLQPRTCQAKSINEYANILNNKF